MGAEDPLREKLLVAEDRVAYVRAAVIFFNIGVYLAFLDPAVGVAWLAWGVIVTASVYALVSVLTRLHRRAKLLMSGWFTTATDSLLITAWIVATGGVHSPFYLLWYVSLAAIAFRFGLRATLTATGIYIAAYGGLVAASGQLAPYAVDVAVRSMYLVFVGVLTGLLAHESTRQWLSKAELRRIAVGEGSGAGLVSREVDMDLMLRMVLDSSRSFVRADRAAVYLVDEETGALRCAYAQGLSSGWIQARTAVWRRLPGVAVLRRAPYLHIADALDDERLGPIREAVQREGFRTYAVFPLQVDGERIGLMSFYRDRVDPFSDVEIELAAALADRAAVTIGNTRLVKELSDSEARLHKVLSNAPVVLFATDRNGVVTMMEGEGTKWLRLDPAWAVGRRVDEVVGEYGGLLEQVRRAAAGHESVAEMDLDSRTFSVHMTPASDASGEVDGAVVVAVDVTERKRAEQERSVREKEQSELEQLREINQFKTLFVNTAAHELRTPLTPIKVQLHLLRAGGLDGLSDRQRNALDVLERNIDRLGHLVEDILEGARIQAGRLKVVKRTVVLDRVVREAVDSFVDAARQNDVTLESDLEPELSVPADAKRIIQVLFNLLSNALKFTPRGGTIRVESSREGDTAVVRVSDTGTGLTREQADRLFRPFSQVHDPMTTVRGGTGLGLFISRSLVEIHGGRICCESAGPGQGSVFTFTLPLFAQLGPQQDGEDWSQVELAQVSHGDLPAEREVWGDGGEGSELPGRDGATPSPMVQATRRKETGDPGEPEFLSRAEKARLARRARELV